LRLLAAVFSGGFLASDDHHVVIGAADQIASGVGLPVTFERTALFPGVIAAIMTVTRGIGIHDPGIEMLVVRLIQAFYSLLVVYFVYRLLERSMGRESAMLGGLLAAAFFAMPVTAVYFEVFPASMALLAALNTKLGGSKSGSPTPKLKTSIPRERSSLARALTSKVMLGTITLRRFASP